jgi:hypothetical protein
METEITVSGYNSEWKLSAFSSACRLIIAAGGRIEIPYCGRVYQVNNVEVASKRLLLSLNSENNLRIVCAPGELVLVLYPPQ